MTASAESSRRPAHRGVASLKLKAGVFAIAGANSLATTWFFYYIYFYAQEKFGFGAAQNFLLAALLGLVYAVFAFLAGRFAQKAGYFASFRIGAAIMTGSVLCCSATSILWLAVALMVLANIGMCFTWPALQGLMSEGEPQKRLRSLVGIYNFTWSVTSALAYFTGGAMIEGWGRKSMFYVPAALFFAEIVFSWWLEKRVNNQPHAPVPSPSSDAPVSAEGRASPIPAGTFLKMAWLANPFAYLAVSTIVSSIPTLAAHLNLDTRKAGFLCSLWLFSRAGAFVLLWLWPRWHYRFRFLAVSYIVMIVCFGGMLLAPSVLLVASFQIVLGIAFGLIYYSSLFYSMDVGETKAEHGGIHEAVIGAGNCGGPAVAAAALYLFPSQPASGTIAVCVLLLIGMPGLFWLRFRNTEA